MPPDDASGTDSASTPEGDAHYLTAVAAVGDSRKLAVARSIYAASGMKLLDAGASLSSRTLDRLVGHRLATPLEDSVALEGVLTPAAVVARTRELARTHALLDRFAAGNGKEEKTWALLARAPLPPSILFRLTVAREKFADLYDHSLRAALVALFLGIGGRLSERELELLATAALMHDFGMLHADPARFAAERPLDAAARRQLRAHPLTGMLIAQREPRLSPVIATAILQHHERLDGSGYPTGAKAEQITRLARILMLVEVVLAMVEHRPHMPELQLSLILRANHRGFDRELAGLLLAALPRVEASEAEASDAGVSNRLADVLAGWDRIKTDSIPGGAEGNARAFIGERMASVRRFLADAGVDPAGAGSAQATLPDDPAAIAESNGVMKEALWHVRQIAYDATLRWPQLGAGDGSSVDPALHDWLRRASDQAGSATSQ
ncbi:MAG TPA: HD domain-containing phosphohydrolase [Burkholderiaceae bacterium]|nr:HD domain-containing phosphohydrolase [Burkholderiaceae bacterium]